MQEHTVGLLPDAFPCPGVEPVRTSLGIQVLSLQHISQVLGAHIAQHTQTFILAVGGDEMKVANKSSGICGVARARHQSERTLIDHRGTPAGRLADCRLCPPPCRASCRRAPSARPIDRRTRSRAVIASHSSQRVMRARSSTFLFGCVTEGILVCEPVAFPFSHRQWRFHLQWNEGKRSTEQLRVGRLLEIWANLLLV